MKAVIGMASICAVAGSASAAVIASTSFENGLTGSIYTDTGDSMMDHDLVNNLGEAQVDFTADMSEMGLDAYYRNTRSSVGLTDGDFVGFSSFTGDVGSYTDGVQGYQMSDTDGLMGVEFDKVAFSGTWGVTLDLFINETGWETGASLDTIRVWVEVDGGTEVDILNNNGADIDDLTYEGNEVEGVWTRLSLDLSAYTTATLHVEFDSNSSQEAIYLDNVVFDGIPTPGSVTLLGLGGLMVARRRR